MNPSWNLGVDEAKFAKVIIANDDITIPKIDELLAMIDGNLEPGMIIGADMNCFVQRRTQSVSTMRIREAYGDGMRYGFGVFMALYKKDYVQVPAELKIWFGDKIQFHTLNPHVFETDIQTKMSVTTRALGSTRQLWIAEHKYYHNQNGK